MEQGRGVRKGGKYRVMGQGYSEGLKSRERIEKRKKE